MISVFPLITLGSPYGIGYEIFLLTLRKTNLFKGNIPFCIGSKRIMDLFQKMLEIDITFKTVSINDIDSITCVKECNFILINIDDSSEKILNVNEITKEIDGEIALKTIQSAGNLVIKEYFKSIVTLPVSKENINIFEPTFKGHTEFFQNMWNQKNVFMTFVSKKINIMLLSTHIPLREVSDYITEKVVEDGIKTALDLKRKLGLAKKICFLGLNPHAGENGLLGNEELWIKEIMKKLDKNDEIDGLIPADTAFTEISMKKYDLYIANYHDQGLIPFKMLAFEDGVNLSFGMKFIRTSVDHGTAVDLIGKKTASLKSFENAYNLATKLS